LTSKNGGNAGFLPCYFPFRSYGTKNRSQSPWNRPIGARLANLTSETSSQLTPPSSGESDELRSEQARSPSDLEVVRYRDLAATERTKLNRPDKTVGTKHGRDKNGG